MYGIVRTLQQINISIYTTGRQRPRRLNFDLGTEEGVIVSENQTGTEPSLETQMVNEDNLNGEYVLNQQQERLNNHSDGSTLKNGINDKVITQETDEFTIPKENYLLDDTVDGELDSLCKVGLVLPPILLGLFYAMFFVILALLVINCVQLVSFQFGYLTLHTKLTISRCGIF